MGKLLQKQGEARTEAKGVCQPQAEGIRAPDYRNAVTSNMGSQVSLRRLH